MMKKLLVAATLLINTTPVLAHTGHLANELAHSFLHIEHIIVITAVALIAYMIKSRQQ